MRRWWRWAGALCAWVLVCCAPVARGNLFDENAVEYFQNDFYGALGVAHDADERTIRRAYRKRSVELHPDRNVGEDRSQTELKEKQFLVISRAKEVLLDPNLRAGYDDFIASLPKSWRPVFGKKRAGLAQANPVVVVVSTIVALLLGISLIQANQFKRERARALGSRFFQEALERETGKGKSEEDFMSAFLEANPELTRTWRDTVGVRLFTRWFDTSKSSSRPRRQSKGGEGNEADAEAEEDAQEEEEEDEEEEEEEETEEERLAREEAELQARREAQARQREKRPTRQGARGPAQEKSESLQGAPLPHRCAGKAHRGKANTAAV